MRLLILALLLGTALFLLVKTQGGREQILSMHSATAQDEVQQNSASTIPAEEVSAPSVTSQQTGEREAAANERVLAARSLYFPHAPEISRTEIPRGEGKEVRRIVKTNLHEPYVEIRESVQRKNGQEMIVSQEAMVANQVLMPKPTEDLTDVTTKLYSLGAFRVQEKGESLLVTFRGDPSDPMALEGFLAKVKAAFPDIAAIEPNYIRKLFSVE